MINFISIQFLIFATATLILYFLTPIRFRWTVLLVASMFFYACTGLNALIFILLSANTAYVTARSIEDNYNSSTPNQKRNLFTLLSGITITLCFLIYSKAGNALASAISAIFLAKPLTFQVIVPLGISYYTFSIIGYMMDVYRKQQAVEHNFFKFLLYMSYFPQILQGSIPRYRTLAPQLFTGHLFCYKNMCYGMQRMIWGYFKKMVIADRFALISSEVFGNYDSYEGLIFVVAAICATIELYCDFSGCIDIALGFSEILSIHLDENFRRPFYSRSAAEFWHRWHITLGTWFKDYVYMPIVSSHMISKLCQKTGKLFGRHFAKNIMSAIPLAIIWILTGLWHGTGANYLVWGCYWGLIIIFSTIFATDYKKIIVKLHIQTDSIFYKNFQILRTCLIYVISRLITVPGDLRVTWKIIQRIFSEFNIWIFFDESLYHIGLDRKDFWVGTISVLILWKVSSLQEKGVKIRDKIASYPLILRWCIYFASILAILIFGIYGSKQAGKTFIYMSY